MRSKESGYNDERQKLVTDMIVGARTIKAYGWENHYMEKITLARKNQRFYVFMQGVLGSLGIAVF